MNYSGTFPPPPKTTIQSKFRIYIPIKLERILAQCPHKDTHNLICVMCNIKGYGHIGDRKQDEDVQLPESPPIRRAAYREWLHTRLHPPTNISRDNDTSKYITIHTNINV